MVSFSFLLLDAIQQPHAVLRELQTVWNGVGIQPYLLEEDR